ncbi:hypothetical protein GCM10009085_53950 [Pseudomonas avellanae]|nr:hypothetical protein GCM10009085_53950 [Pseudomonas avellanae]
MTTNLQPGYVRPLADHANRNNPGAATTSKIIDHLLGVWRLIGYDLTDLPLGMHKVSYAMSVLNICRNH